MRVARSSLQIRCCLAVIVALTNPWSRARAQSLNDAGAWALRASLSLQGDDERQNAVRAKLRGAYEAFLPRVTWEHDLILGGRIDYLPDYSSITNSYYGGIDTMARRDPNVYGVQLSFPILDGLKRFNDLQAAKSALREGAYLNIDKRQQVLLDTANAYLAVLRDRKTVALRRELVNDLTAISKRVGVQYAVRDATRADFALAESRVQAGLVALEGARAALSASEIELQRLTQANIASLERPLIPSGALPDTADSLRQATLAQSPKIRAAQLGAEAAEYLAKTAYAPLLPQLNLIASRTDQTNLSQIQNRIRDTSVRLQLLIPIYEPGAFSGVSAAKALATRKRFESLDLERQLVAANQALFQARRATTAQIAQARQRASEIKRVVDGYKVERDAGLRTVIDVLNVQAEWTEARVAQVNLEYERDRLTYTIAATLGRLDTGERPPP
jgi:outer membrane protein